MFALEVEGEAVPKIYIGTYTGGESQGIYMAGFNPDSGSLSDLQLAAETDNPSFLAHHPSQDVVYAVNETASFKGEPGGGLSAFKIDPDTGLLKLINQGNTGGGAPCHLVVDSEGKHVLVANYSGGNVAVFKIQANGGIEKRTDIKQHVGSSQHSRQKGPHAHGIYLSQDQRFCLVTDLGLDKVLIYQFDRETGTLSIPPQASASTAPAAGPRHFAIHPTEKWAYAINELNNTVTVFDFDPATGGLEVRESYSTLPSDFTGTSHTAEIVVSPDGKFLFGSNRGHDSIVVYAIDPAHGKLTCIEHELTGGKTPRNFAVDPTGQWLLAANQGSDSIVVFSINRDSGELTPTGTKLSVPKPVCVLF